MDVDGELVGTRATSIEVSWNVVDVSSPLSDLRSSGMSEFPKRAAVAELNPEVSAPKKHSQVVTLLYSQNPFDVLSALLLRYAFTSLMGVNCYGLAASDFMA